MCCWYSTNGFLQTAKACSGRLEVEDGEIEDARLSNANSHSVGQAMQAAAPNSEKEGKALSNAVPPTAQPKVANTPQEASISSSASRTPLVAESHPPPQHVLTSNTQETGPKLPTTSGSIYSPVPPRPEPARTTLAGAPNGRLQHVLPSRPEIPPPVSEHRVSERPGERGLYSRDSRFPERSRTDRSGGPPRDRMLEPNVPEPYPRRYDQGNDKPLVPDRNRVEPGWTDEKSVPGRAVLDDRHSGPRRASGPPSRDERISRDRATNEQLHHPSPRVDYPGQSLREAPMPPPRLNTSQHPDRAAVLNQGPPDHPQPLNNHQPDRRPPEPPRYEVFPNSERIPRASSPMHSDDRNRIVRREDRPPLDRRISEEGPHSHLSRFGESHLPTGPRGTSSQGGSTDRFREAMKVDSAITQPIDSNVGRLNQDSSHHGRPQESQYGRLNPAAEIPSGPRLSNGHHPSASTRGPRNLSAPQPQINTQQQQSSSHKFPPASPTQEKQAPTGPAERGGSRNPANFSRPEAAPSTAPVTSAENQDTAGVHPDRLKAIQGLVNERSVAQGSSAVLTPSNNNQTQANPAHSASQPLSAVLPPTPVGPRGINAQLSSPIKPLPTNREPPTGPSFSNERNRGDKRFAGIQNMLQQSNAPNGQERGGQGASIRGRGGRSNHVNVPSPSASNPPTPSIARPEPFPPRTDLFAERKSGPTTPQQVDEDVAYGRGRRGGRDAPREVERRSERHRGNRSRSPALPMPSREEERLRRREDVPERPPRGAPPPPHDRDMRRPGPRDEPGRGRRSEPDRRDMDDWNGPRRGEEIDRRDERERRDGGGGGGSGGGGSGSGSGRKRGRAGDDGQGDRGRSDNKRSRRMN